MNFIFYFGTSYFQNSGIKNPFIISVITDVVNVSSTIPGLYLVEKWGRRPLLMFGAIGKFNRRSHRHSHSHSRETLTWGWAGMCVSQFIVAIVGTTVNNSTSNKVLIAFVCFFIFFFACSWGPCAWVVTGKTLTKDDTKRDLLIVR